MILSAWRLTINSKWNKHMQVRILLSRPEKDWKNKCLRDSVGCMMGFYLMAGSKPNRNQSILHEVRLVSTFSRWY